MRARSGRRAAPPNRVCDGGSGKLQGLWQRLGAKWANSFGIVALEIRLAQEQNLQLLLKGSSKASPEWSQASSRGPRPNPPTIIEGQQRGLPRVVPPACATVRALRCAQLQGAQDPILRLLLKDSSEASPEWSQASSSGPKTQSSDYY